jgi:outer membrane protein insertion porin family
MIRKIFFAVFLCTAAFAMAQTQYSENQVASVRIEGNKRIATETYLYYISVKPGSLYDDMVLREDFRRLWQTGFLDDLKVEEEKTPGGVNVVFKVTERYLIKSIEYTGNKKISKDDIQTKLKDENITLRVDQPFDPFVGKKVTNAIEKLMLEKGLQFGTASYKLDPINESFANLVFAVDEGPKVKIGEIDFVGNKVFSDKKLKRTMKDTREHWMFSFISRHDDFEKEKFEKDKEKVSDLYFNKGYINARIDEPEVQLLPNRNRMKLTIPVVEGDQYHVGEITFTGNKVFTSQALLPTMELKKGAIFNRSLLKKGMDEIQKMYGDQGYIYTGIGPVFVPDEKNKVINLRMEVDENERFYVNRIEFTGNDFTRDKVIRRELELQEGDLLRVNRFRDSLDHIYRLGFFDDVKPNITPVPESKNTADISIDVKENKRNEIQVGGGYSQIDGFFGNLVFTTKNLFGSGKVLSVQLQGGTVSSNYNVSILEPYFMDRPVSIGFSVFKSRYNYTTYLQENVGGSLTFGFPVLGEFRGILTYVYQIVNLTYAPGITPGTGNPLFPGFSLLQNDRAESRLVPQLVRSTINNPIDPTRGSRFVTSLVYSGGVMGGDIDYYKPSFSFTQYLPALSKKQHIAYNVEAGWGSGFGHGPLEGVLPYYERYFLGGENSIRGYDYRIVSPIAIDPTSKLPYLAGGNKFFQLNAEYVFNLVGPLKLAGFLDYGNAFITGIDFKNMRGSTGAELRFLVPLLSAPFRFIYAFNFNRGDLMTLPESSRPKRTVFRFSVGTTF